MRSTAAGRAPRLLVALTLLLAASAAAQAPSPLGKLLDDLLPHRPARVQLPALKAIEASGDRAAIPALIELLRFELDVPGELHAAVLEQLSGERFGRDWPRWVEWLQQHPEIRPHREFLRWKWRLFTLIDADFGDWFQPAIPHRIRMEEIVWGGVAKDGIPALMSPAHLQAARATYLTEDEFVLGVTLNGESRAYPHRIMDWHEMANDIVGGVPVALAY